jgi:cytochrome c peroxidase
VRRLRWRAIDLGFHNLGIGFAGGRFADAGRYRVTGVQSDLGAFRTPSLRNVAVTAPYMHDGSLATLEDVVDFYDAGGRPNPFLSPFIRPLYLDDYEKAALVAFLRTLTDQQFEHLASGKSGSTYSGDQTGGRNWGPRRESRLQTQFN